MNHFALCTLQFAMCSHFAFWQRVWAAARHITVPFKTPLPNVLNAAEFDLGTVFP
jgi:hypothetical protein